MQTRALALIVGAVGCVSVSRAGHSGELPTSDHPAAGAEPSARPVLHFTPEKNWINDPNGLIWLDGEYHLFYQHNPLGDQWGHMSWGHAVSKDLLAWEHLAIAIPEADGVMAFSGTSVFDRNNTSGFAADGRQALVAVYTGHDERAKRQHQNLAFSTDRGRTWTKYAGNPVLDLGVENFRDPKVFWHHPTSRWIMVVALANDRKALFYSSHDLKKWTKLSEFGPQGRGDVPNWECPDLFELPVDGDAGNTRWVLVINVGGNGPAGGSGCQYFVGSFDGEKFHNESPPGQVLWLDHGKDFYAFQSFEDVPGGKRIGLAWMANASYAGATPTSPWRGSMSLPREFTLTATSEGIRIAQMPIAGVGMFLKARGATDTVLEQREVRSGVTRTAISAQVALIEAEFEVGTAERLGLRVLERGDEFTVIGYDVKLEQLFIDRRHSGRTDFHSGFAGIHAARMPLAHDGRVKFTIVVDRGSVEVFGNGGGAVVTSLVFPNAGGEGVSLFADGGDARLFRLDATVLGSR